MSDISKLLQSQQVEAGLAIALRYLQAEFPACRITVVDLDSPYGVPDRAELARSVWMDFQGPQRVFFTMQVLEALAHLHNPLDLLRQWGVADFIRQVGCVPIRVATHGPERC
jgi:hypothetical protein